MKKTVLVLSAAVALSVMTAPVALAQDTSPSCDEAKANLTKLEKKRDDVAAGERVKENDALKVAKDQVRDTQVKLKRAQDNLAQGVKDEKTGAELQALKDDVKKFEDRMVVVKAARDKAQEDLDKDSSKLAGLRAQVELAIQERDDACGAATTAPTPTPTPEPENDVDCDEVSDDEAQRILNGDRSDPNNLDQDGDGIACEVDEILPESDDDNDVVVNNNVAVPSGGVATGGGPAWAFQ